MKNDDNKTMSIYLKEADSDFSKELSKYLRVLGNEKRLKILKLIEKEPMDVRTIASEIDTCYANAKKHIDKLLSIGVIKMEAGEGRETSRGISTVWKYSLIPGGLELIIRNLGLFSSFKFELSDKIKEANKNVSKEFAGKVPVFWVLGGVDDGKVFPIKKDCVKIGREDPPNEDKYDPQE